jgi:hypothetical protein
MQLWLVGEDQEVPRLHELCERDGRKRMVTLNSMSVAAIRSKRSIWTITRQAEGFSEVGIFVRKHSPLTVVVGTPATNPGCHHVWPAAVLIPFLRERVTSDIAEFAMLASPEIVLKLIFCLA